MSYELWPETAHFVCACGCVFFEHDKDRMWDHAREHVERNRAMRVYQNQFQSISTWPPTPEPDAERGAR